MARKGKRYLDAVKRLDRDQLYSPAEAVDLVKGLATARFDETIEIAIRLGVDPRRADQIVRGSLSLPAGTGRSVRVAVFAAGEQAAEARAAGAEVVGSDDLVARIEKEGFLEFDVAIATPDLMVQVGRLGRVLGPRGLMPNPRTGTVTLDVAKAVGEYKSGRVEYRTDRVGNVHVPVGKASFDQPAILRNTRAVLEEIQRAKPSGAKGRYIRSVTLCSTMGPGVKIDPSRLRPTEEELAATA
jgi:large subunit ribosomal protein L1